MKVIYRWAREEDYLRLIELANHAFDPEHFTGDFLTDTSEASFFPSCVPKLYDHNPSAAPMHYVAEQDGKLVGIVGLFDLPTMVGGHYLQVGGIGTVCTHPEHRRKGYMRKLMDDVIEEARRKKMDYLVLGGQRQRYENWGFEYAGINPVFVFNSGNFDRIFGKNVSFGYQFTRIDAADTELLANERRLRIQEGIYQIRDDELEWRAIYSGFHIPYAIMKAGKVQGTFSIYGKKGDSAAVYDLRLYDTMFSVEIINDLIKAFPDYREIRVTNIAPENQSLISALYRVADNVMITWNQMIKILNYRRTLQAYLDYAASYRRLADGHLVVQFETQEILEITVRDGKPFVSEVDKQPEAILTETEAVNLLFSPGGMLTNLNHGINCIAQSWLPLPFFIAISDEV